MKLRVRWSWKRKCWYYYYSQYDRYVTTLKFDHKYGIWLCVAVPKEMWL